MVTICACGCGSAIKPTNTFAHGHNGRVRSDESTERIRQASLERWKDPAFRAKRKKALAKVFNSISVTVKKLWTDPTYRKNMTTAKKRNNSSKKVSISLKENWNDLEYVKNHTGENASNWQGGKSFVNYPKEFNDELKEAVRKRDNYLCRRCKCPEGDHGGKLCVHHINFDTHCSSKHNLLSLCRSCHRVVHNLHRGVQ